MDSSNQMPNQQPQILQQPDPVGSAPVMQQAPTPKKMLWVIGAIIILILIAAGVYFYLNSKQASNQSSQSQTTQVTQTPKEDLEGDLNSVDVAGSDQDFSSVDQDLQSL